MNEDRINAYIARLTKEWREHSKIIIAVDFDSTISPWQSIDNQKDIDRAIDLIKKAKETGAFITIWTACSDDRFKDILSYCETKEISVDSINENVVDLPYGKGKKIYANIYLDDRAGLIESLDILETSMYNQRSYIAQGQYRKLNDVA